MKFSEMRKAANDWLEAQRGFMDCFKSVESIEEYKNYIEGFAHALYIIGRYSEKQENAVCKDISAIYAAAMKKTALGVTSTENGSKKGCPTGDKNISHNFSIAITPPDVKWSGNDIYRLIQSMIDARISGERIVCILQSLFRPQKERQGKTNETA